MTTNPDAGVGIGKRSWLLFVEEATPRWLKQMGPLSPEIASFGSYIRDQRYAAKLTLGDLAANLDIPLQQLALLERGLLRPSEVAGPAWVRLIRILEGREQILTSEQTRTREDQQPDNEEPVTPSDPTEERSNMEISNTTNLPDGEDPFHPIGVARVRVIGIGGGGTNAVSRMFRQRIPGVEYMSVNTDAQHLLRSDVPIKFRIGDRLTRGLGVGGDPDLGHESAEESREELYEAVRGCDLVFVAAGMGGGTGTGAAPVIAEIAKESGALTIAVVTKPFSFEGRQRAIAADKGIVELQDKVDTLIVIPNDRILSISDQNMTADNAFNLADEVLRQGVQAIAELVTTPGEINLDLADVKTVMAGAGPAWMAIGMGRGEGRAVSAARTALASPLLDAPIEGARRVLMNITGGSDLTLQEVQEAADFIRGSVDSEANIIFGMVTDPKMEDEVQVTVIATDLPAYESELLAEGDLEIILEESVAQEMEREQDGPDLRSLWKRIRNIGRN